MKTLSTLVLIMTLARPALAETDAPTWGATLGASISAVLAMKPAPMTGRESVEATTALHAEQRRVFAEQAELKVLGAQLRDWSASLVTRPDAAVDTAVDEIMASLARMRAIVADCGHPVAEPPPALLEAFQHDVTAEKTCRADAKCIGKRRAEQAERDFFTVTVQPMCAADQDRETQRAFIVHENANPSGYVNVVDLHMAGAQIQQDEATLASFAAEYVKVRKHAWRGWHSECH
jgi:hypothetical protein